MIIPTANEVTTRDVAFGKRFGTIPFVAVNPASSVPQTISACAGSITETGFTIYLYRTGTTETRIDWCAVERK